MADRFYCPDLSASSATLSDTEAHHALHVLRIKTGHEIDLFDGRGTTAVGVVESASRRDVVVTINERQTHQQKDIENIVVAACPPKGERLKWMIEKLAELGVHQYTPLQTTRSVVEPHKLKREKLVATTVAASKQCGRNWLMQIGEPTKLETLVSAITPNDSLHIAHPYPLQADEQSEKIVTTRTVLIGPEGGFTDEEVELAAAAGAQPLTWPGTVLRIETAAIMAAVTLQQGQ